MKNLTSFRNFANVCLRFLMWRHRAVQNRNFLFLLLLQIFFFQITDALTFLHVSCRHVHRNICPNSVYVTKPGTWKLAGLEFIGKHEFTITVL